MKRSAVFTTNGRAEQMEPHRCRTPPLVNIIKFEFVIMIKLSNMLVILLLQKLFYFLEPRAKFFESRRFIYIKYVYLLIPIYCYLSVARQLITIRTDSWHIKHSVKIHIRSLEASTTGKLRGLEERLKPRSITIIAKAAPIMLSCWDKALLNF